MVFCPRCKTEKEDNEFYKNKCKKNGYSNQCKQCQKKYSYDYVRRNHVKEKEKIRTRNRNRIKKGISLDIPVGKTREIGVGKGYKNKYGYIILCRTEHFASNKEGRISEHHFVMCNYLNRKLTKFESVHHKNGIRDDNRLENLELWSRFQPYGQRVEDKISWCKEFLDQYGYDVTQRNIDR